MCEFGRSRRPAGEARGGGILDVLRRRATTPTGMDRPSKFAQISSSGSLHPGAVFVLPTAPPLSAFPGSGRVGPMPSSSTSPIPWSVGACPESTASCSSGQRDGEDRTSRLRLRLCQVRIPGERGKPRPHTGGRLACLESGSAGVARDEPRGPGDLRPGLGVAPAPVIGRLCALGTGLADGRP